MTNIIKQTLTEKQAAIEEQLQAALVAKNELVIFRTRSYFTQALEEHPEVSIQCRHGDSISFMANGKDILSIDSKGWNENATYYLNTYSTWVESDFEINRLIFNGKIAGIISNENVLQQIGFIFSNEGKMADITETISTLRSELNLIRREITKIEHEETEARKAKTLQDFYAGGEIILNGLKTIYYGKGKYDSICRVSKLKCTNSNTSGKKVTVEFTCLSYDTDIEVTHKKEDIQTKYLIDQLIVGNTI
jgi:hypothetical protein